MVNKLKIKHIMSNTGIFFGGKDNGSTAKVARKIQETIGAEKASVHNVANATQKDVEKYDFLILGTAAWGIGEMHTDWERFIDKLIEADLSKTKIALFGLGDQKLYPESFVDGMGTIFCRLANKQNVVGYTETRGYHFYYSTAEKDGKFVGLAIDDDTQPEFTDKRIKDWVKQLKKEAGI
jgi:flavodoxin I